jgi:hypothetical protein
MYREDCSVPRRVKIAALLKANGVGQTIRNAVQSAGNVSGCALPSAR